MSKTKKVIAKKSSLTHEEQEELVYYLREAMSRNLEAQSWNSRAAQVERKISQRLGINADEYDIDWSESMVKGIVSYKKKEAPNENKVS